MKLHYYFLLLILGVSPMVSSAQNKSDSTMTKTYDFGHLDIEAYRRVFVKANLEGKLIIDSASSYVWPILSADIYYLHSPDFFLTPKFSVELNNKYFAPMILGVETHKYWGTLVNGVEERRRGDLTASTQVGYRAGFEIETGLIWEAKVRLSYWLSPKVQAGFSIGIGNNGRNLNQTLVTVGGGLSYMLNQR